MTATNTKLLVRAVLEALREDIDDEASWAAIRDLAEEGAFDDYRSPFCGHMTTVLKQVADNNDSRVWVMYCLCEFVADQAKSQIQEVQTHAKYREPGYDLPKSGIVAVGDWNRVVDDDTPELLGDLLEKLDVNLEWYDEWSSCSNCGGLIRTKHDSMHWTPSYTLGDGEILCHECVPPAQEEQEEEEPLDGGQCVHSHTTEPSENHVGRQCLDCGVYLF